MLSVNIRSQIKNTHNMSPQRKIKQDSEKMAFANDVLESIQQARRGEGRVHQVTLTMAAEARARVGLTQSAFAQLMGVSVRTLQNWEQGRSQPSGAAKTLIKVAQQWPEVLRSMA